MKKFLIFFRKIGSFFIARAAYTLIVGGSLSACAIYLYLIEVDRYVSHVRVRVESESASSVPSIELGLVSLGGATSSIQDAQLLMSYIQSPTMLEDLNQDLNLRAHYSQAGIDPLSRLSKTDSNEKFLDYYLSRVSVEIDDKAQLLLIDVQGFDPGFTQKIAEGIIRHAEDFVNELNHALAREQIKFMESQVAAANQRMEESSRRLEAFQSKNQMFSPTEETQVVGQIIAGLQQQLSSENAKLEGMLAYLNANAPDVRKTRQRIRALQNQLDSERQRQVGGGGDGINNLQLEFREAQTEAQLSIELYKSNLASLESVKTAAIKKVKHLVRVSGPTLPDSSEEPKRGFTFVTLIVVFNILYLIGKLIVATIKDHQD